ncbi:MULTISPECIES: MarR family winged helix-turn-helix transcriptional regulator [unclassified Paludibacterium]|uniref:MarR family winged helix-turn-helix transcriptional regulator n=1 Tax=unclassified Paludibacterium TaxID=2618429 RepID=UPI001C059542|nr:MarR family transcriptional regulator [Paludibacterium sp. B53371]BEV70551.1 MarR family transcriptional regulator [Paludibacterium sp. THUN1379]
MTWNDTPFRVTPEDLTCVPSSEALGYLILGAKRRLTEILEEELAPLGLTAAQSAVIMQLYRGEENTPAGFCRLLDYDPGAMTRLLYRIEHKGLLRRAQNPQDRRSFRFELTEAGRALCPAMLERICQAHNRLLAGLGQQDADTLRRLLQCILRRH